MLVTLRSGGKTAPLKGAPRQGACYARLMGRGRIWVLGWLSGFCAALGVAAIFWGAMMIDVGIEFVLVGTGLLGLSIILAAWGFWKVGHP